MRENSTSSRFWYVVRSVLTSPLSLLLWAAGGVVCYLMKSPLPLAGAALLQIVLLYTRLHSESYLRSLFEEREERTEVMSEQQIEALLDQMDFETRQRLRYILQLQKEIVREARDPDAAEYARSELAGLAREMGPLVQQALKLGQRKQQLVKYLRNVDEKALSAYCANVKKRLASEKDPVTKGQLEQTLHSREAELQNYASINQAAARIDSQLERVEATFASWKAQVIRIKTADLAGATSATEDLSQELSALSQNIDLLDKSVREALSSETATQTNALG